MPPPILPYIPPAHPLFQPPDAPFSLPPAANIPEENRGEKAQGAAGFFQPPAGGPVSIIPEGNRGEKAAQETGVCVRRLCLPKATLTGLQPSDTCVCWSDIIVYAAAILMVLFGAWSIIKR